MITVCVGLSARSSTSTTSRFSSRLLATSRQNGVTMSIAYSSEKIGFGHQRRWLARTAATRMAVVLTLRGALSGMGYYSMPARKPRTARSYRSRS